MIKKPSLFKRLAGSVSMRSYEDEPEDDFEVDAPTDEKRDPSWQGAQEEVQEEGELPIDMYQTAESIVIRTLIAGVSPDDLDIAITRDMVTIKGAREEDREAPDENYYHRELYWGGFSRTILLPEEILIDEAEAKEKHGLLEIILPKVDKARSARLKVKTK
ncbi:Hsp20/alpha crystallin family protein [Candidatus Kaiserbacteria bacterium]|nr:Hsp20/alpha crystallin family protein [Candidatus Kaiserbacteria bacterium]